MTCRDLQPVDRLRPMSSIVILEEDDLMRGLLTEWLTGAGYAVRERGLRAAPAGEGADLVIVDLSMPRQAAADIVLAAQPAVPGAPGIALPAQCRPGPECSARAAG